MKDTCEKLWYVWSRMRLVATALHSPDFDDGETASDVLNDLLVEFAEQLEALKTIAQERGLLEEQKEA